MKTLPHSLLFLALATSGGAFAQDPHAGQGKPQAKASAHDAHAGHAMPPAAKNDPHAGHAMPPKAASDTPREPVPALTPDDFTAAFPVMKPHAMEHAPAFNSLVVFDQLEAWDNAHGGGQAWGIDAWFGGDINRLWLRSEGHRSDNALGDWSVDALYGRAISRGGMRWPAFAMTTTGTQRT
nr:copper resistance protein B [Stenotrophomonas pictorum]